LDFNCPWISISSARSYLSLAGNFKSLNLPFRSSNVHHYLCIPDVILSESGAVHLCQGHDLSTGYQERKLRRNSQDPSWISLLGTADHKFCSLDCVHNCPAVDEESLVYLECFFSQVSFPWILCLKLMHDLITELSLVIFWIISYRDLFWFSDLAFIDTASNTFNLFNCSVGTFTSVLLLHVSILAPSL